MDNEALKKTQTLNHGDTEARNPFIFSHVFVTPWFKYENTYNWRKRTPRNQPRNGSHGRA